MAAPAFGSAGTQTQPTTATLSVDVPDSVAAGDIIVVTAFLDCLGANVTVTGLATDFAQAPDSPVEVNPAAFGTNVSNRLYIMWKRATGADSTAGTYDFTLSASVYCNAQAIRYTGAIASGDPWDVTNSAQTGNTSVNDTPSVSDTTTVADTLLVWAASNWTGGAWTPPTSFTERRDSGDQVCTVADLAQSAAGATGSIVGTCAGSNRSGAWVGALKSAVAVADTSIYSPPKLPGRVGPDGKIFAPNVRYDDFTAAAAATNAPAGDALATGAALQSTIALGINLGLASGTGTAPQPVAAVRPGAGVGAATGSAPQSSVALGVNAGVASATGSALQATVQTSVAAQIIQPVVVTPTAQTVLLRRRQAVAAFVDPGVSEVGGINAPAGLASGTGSALQPTVSVSGSTNAPAGLASASGSALAPTIAVGVRPAVASGTGAANQPRGSEGVNAGTASGTGSAFTASIAIRATAGVATANGVGNQATVSISGSVNVPAGVATATGTAQSPSPAVAPVAATPTATGTALAGRINLTALVGVATANGTALGVTGPIQPVTPHTRTYLIPADPRELEVSAENRTFTVPADTRTFMIPGDEEA